MEQPVKAHDLEGLKYVTDRSYVPVLADEEGVLAVFGLGVHEGRRALALPAVRVRLSQNNQEETNGGSEYGK